MKCLHCREGFYETWEPMLPRDNNYKRDSTGAWGSEITVCPTCGKAIIRIIHRPLRTEAEGGGEGPPVYTFVYPRSMSRTPLPPEVPEGIATDFAEACVVLQDSEKASAALSRRLLQQLIRDHVGVAGLRDLIQEIAAARPLLPSYLAAQLDAVREIGNLAAHPTKGTNPGEIVDVEVGEAEWSLEVLEALFDFCFVQPQRLADRKAALNEKLRSAGKREMA